MLVWGLLLQFAFAILVLKTSFGAIFQQIGAGVNAMLGYSAIGSEFVFGPLGTQAGPFPASLRTIYGGNVVFFAFQVLPIVIFIASFFAIMYYLGVMQVLVKAMAIVMQKGLRRQRRGIVECGRQHLHGPNGSSADHPAVSRRAHAVGTVYHHGQRHGARIGRGDGRVRCRGAREN